MKTILATLIGLLLLAAVPVNDAYGVERQSEGMLNVNTASREVLAWFLWRQGIGNALEISDNIVAYRESNGPFGDIGELRQVRGITGYEFDRIKLRAKVQGESTYRAVAPDPRPAYPYPRAPDSDYGSMPDRYPDNRPYGPWRIRP